MLRNWLKRHRDPFNFWIHMVGIPMAVAGLVLLIAAWPQWWWGVGGLVGGYVLQWLGHLVEGNDLGEMVAIKRAFGLPAVAVSPRFEQAVQERAA